MRVVSSPEDSWTGVKDQPRIQKLLVRDPHDFDTSQPVANLQLCQEV